MIYHKLFATDRNIGQRISAGDL